MLIQCLWRCYAADKSFNSDATWSVYVQNNENDSHISGVLPTQLGKVCKAHFFMEIPVSISRLYQLECNLQRIFHSIKIWIAYIVSQDKAKTKFPRLQMTFSLFGTQQLFGIQKHQIAIQAVIEKTFSLLSRQNLLLHRNGFKVDFIWIGKYFIRKARFALQTFLWRIFQSLLNNFYKLTSLLIENTKGTRLIKFSLKTIFVMKYLDNLNCA